MPNSTNHSVRSRLHRLRHQAVRDLAWCCVSAPIMRKLPGAVATILPFHDEQLWPWLAGIDQQPDALLAHLAQIKSTRIGIYYEALWRFYFSHRPRWELLQHNLQVRRNGITLGAFDFLCRRGNDYWHIETAVKFYLCHAPDAQRAHNWHNWIGPSNLDRLDLKLNHLRQHQLPLHETVEAKIRLQALYPAVATWKTGLCLQGYLFSPASAHYSPAFSHINHGKGHWWYLRDFIHYQRQLSNTQWHILERRHWLSPAHVDSDMDVSCGDKFSQQLQKEISEWRRPVLIAAMHKTAATDSYWQEDWRGFVVPDNWPAATD